MDLEQHIDAIKANCAESAKWQAEHDGRINAWWAAQHKWNEEMESRMRSIERMGYKATGVWAAVLFAANLVAALVIYQLTR